MPTAGLLLLSVTGLGLWGRAHRLCDEWSWSRVWETGTPSGPAYVRWSVVNATDGLRLCRTRGDSWFGSDGVSGWDGNPPRGGFAHEAAGERSWQIGSYVDREARREYGREFHAAGLTLLQVRDMDAFEAGRVWTLVMPPWVFAAGCAVVAVALDVGRRLRRRRRGRRVQGLCPVCGYDLRSSPGRCPECGAEPLVARRPTSP